MAARRIAEQRNPQRGMKTEVIRPSHEKEDRKALSALAKEIRQTPAFTQLMSTISKKPEIRAGQLANFAANGGQRLEQTLNQYSQPQPQMGI